VACIGCTCIMSKLDSTCTASSQGSTVQRSLSSDMKRQEGGMHRMHLQYVHVKQCPLHAAQAPATAATPAATVAPATPGAPLLGATTATAATTPTAILTPTLTPAAATNPVTPVSPPATGSQAGAVATGPNNATPSGGWNTAAAKVSLLVL